MNEPRQAFHQSLDLTSPGIEPFIPYILTDLWELGSMPDYIIRLVRANIQPGSIAAVTDFGCGKGAVLIKLARKMHFRGLGIDRVPEFIKAARQFAEDSHVAARLTFQTGDLREWISRVRRSDLVIYGYDSDLLGDVQTSLRQLSRCVSAGGWIILEAAATPEGTPAIEGIPGEGALNDQITGSGLVPVDRILWDADELTRVNARNNQLIGARITELISAHPDKAQLFQRYLENQLAECRQLENAMVCSTWLLRKQA
jgi:SAM-dependent methyltransferase